MAGRGRGQRCWESASAAVLEWRGKTRSAAPGPRRIAFPVLLVAQRWYRARYLRALRDTG